MGYSFAAGTTDGPGAFDFHQGINFRSFVSLIFNKINLFEKKVTPKPLPFGIWSVI